MPAAVMLLVTWIVQGQPPNSYQAAFGSIAACENGKAQLFADAARMRQTMLQEAIVRGRSMGIPDNLTSAGFVAPALTAICVSQ